MSRKKDLIQKKLYGQQNSLLIVKRFTDKPNEQTNSNWWMQYYNKKNKQRMQHSNKKQTEELNNNKQLNFATYKKTNKFC